MPLPPSATSLSPLELLKKAQEFYVSRDIGSLPAQLTAQSLFADDLFVRFHAKFETAFDYYSRSGYTYPHIEAHLGGIDFHHPVSIVTIPAGQKHTQLQVAWGPQGNYYSTSENTAPMLGISSQGVPFHLRESSDQRMERLRAKMIAARGLDYTTRYESEYPQPPLNPQHRTQAQSPAVATKLVRTYEATDDVIALLSTARDIIDTWSVPNTQTHCPGGGMQLYVLPSENAKMKQVAFGAHDTPEDNEYTFSP